MTQCEKIVEYIKENGSISTMEAFNELGITIHAFLCSAADEEHIFLVYCGKMFAHDYHTYPSYILMLDWNGNLIDAYRFDRWIQAISPGTETGVFYLTVYADDDSSSARMKLIKVIPQQ